MNAVACIIKCSCGGVVVTAEDGVWYVLCEDNAIVFQGVCSECGEAVKVRRGLTSMLVQCPNPEGKRLN